MGDKEKLDAALDRVLAYKPKIEKPPKKSVKNKPEIQDKNKIYN